MKIGSQEWKDANLKEMQEYAKARGGLCLSTEYISSHTKYLWQDSEGNQGEAVWYNYKQRGGWSKKDGYARNAKKLIKYTVEGIQTKFADPKQGRLLSTEYKNTKTKLLWEDSQGRQFWMDLEHVIAGQWSPHEKKEALAEAKRKYSYEFCDQFARKNGGGLLSPYMEVVTLSTKLKWVDRNGEVFIRPLHSVLSCDDLLAQKKSIGEYEIGEFLKSLGCEFKCNDRSVLGNKKEVDFFIPDSALAIEYHGLKWHTEEHLGSRNYHLDKFNSANKMGLSLLQVFQHEWKDRNSQVKSFIKSKLNKNTIKVHARKCIIKPVVKKDAVKFLNDYHIQGSGNFKEAFGAFYNGELLMLIAIGDHHRDSKSLPVLTRCVSKDNVTVVGGLSRLCKYASNTYPEFITWIDLRWSNGDSWLANGWTKEEQLKPDYFYYHPDKKTIQSKQSRAKHKLATPEGMTERDFAKAEGFERVYDCGKLRLKYIKA